MCRYRRNRSRNFISLYVFPCENNFQIIHQKNKNEQRIVLEEISNCLFSVSSEQILMGKYLRVKCFIGMECLPRRLRRGSSLIGDAGLDLPWTASFESNTKNCSRKNQIWARRSCFSCTIFCFFSLYSILFTKKYSTFDD